MTQNNRNTDLCEMAGSGLLRKHTAILCWMIICVLTLSATSFAYQTRNFYGARLEPVSTVLHGAGQDFNGFDNYVDEMDAGEHPTIYMAYYNIWDEFADDLRADLDNYSTLYGDYLSVQIGLYLVDSYQEIAGNALDQQVENFCKQLEQLGYPVYLRIGYEANGSHNGYEPNSYKSAFIKITNTIRNLGLDDVATVWCIVPDAESNYMPYYPGDSYVDWWSIDLFFQGQITGSNTSNFLTNADSHGKPVMIGESSPADYQTTGGWTSWNGWFVPYFNLIDNRPEIKAFCYINWNWPVDMPELASWGDCRLESNTIVANNYRNQMDSALYLHGSNEISFRQTGLGITDSTSPGKAEGLTVDTGTFPMEVSWDPITDDTGINRYQILRNSQPIGFSVNETFGDEDIIAGKTYMYSVKAVDLGGNQGQESGSLMAVMPPSMNKLINGQFDQDKTEWRNEVFAAGNTMYFNIDTTSKISGTNSAKLTITQSSGVNWHSQLRQIFNAKQGHQYQVRFRAMANTATSMDIFLQEFAAPYGIFLNRNASLTTTPQTFTFNATSPDDDYIALSFCVGASGIRTIWIDEITLTEISNDPDPQNCSEVQSSGSGISSDLTGNCYVDNGDFNAIAEYWQDNNCGTSNNCQGADFQPDGYVNLSDLQYFAYDWLSCNNPQDGSCTPTW